MYFLHVSAVPNLDSLRNKETEYTGEDQDQAIVARVLSDLRPKDENKFGGKRDQNQARRRMVRGHSAYYPTSTVAATTTAATSSSTTASTWSLLDLLLESKQKNKSFVSFLPPPPPRTTSKILPSSSSSSSPNNPTQLPSVYSSNKPFSQSDIRVFGSVNPPQRIAPAVQIRSVIPVCAAPPVKQSIPKPNNNNTTCSMSTETGAEISTSVTSMINSLEL